MKETRAAVQYAGGTALNTKYLIQYGKGVLAAVDSASGGVLCLWFAGSGQVNIVGGLPHRSSCSLTVGR